VEKRRRVERHGNGKERVTAALRISSPHGPTGPLKGEVQPTGERKSHKNGA